MFVALNREVRAEIIISFMRKVNIDEIFFEYSIEEMSLDIFPEIPAATQI